LPVSPIADGSVDHIFSEHFIEHIPRDSCVLLFAQIRRLLRPGIGVARISTPDIALFLRGYTEPGQPFYAKLQQVLLLLLAMLLLLLAMLLVHLFYILLVLSISYSLSPTTPH
jgi:hypothetical protein